jgi:flagellar protein FliO/FliZ
MTDVIRPEQIVTLALFLAVLGLVWLLVRMNRHGLARRLTGARRLRLAEVLPLSPADRALIVEADGQSFLLVRCKGAAPLIQPLGPARAEAPPMVQPQGDAA